MKWLLSAKDRTARFPPLSTTPALLGVPLQWCTRLAKGMWERWRFHPERREFERRSLPLLAFYWSGGPLNGHPVSNISQGGAFIRTTDFWCPGTALDLRLQAAGDIAATESILLHALIVRQQADGFGVAFMFENHQEQKHLNRFLGEFARRVHAHSHAQSGHSLVEFALMIPLMFLLMVNAVNFGGFFFAWITMANAARSASQYQIMGGATVTSPKPATSSQIYNLVTADISSLPGRSSLAVRVCTNNAGAIACTTTGSGSFSNPPADTRSEANSFVMAWVDVKYTYQPFIPLFNFPNLGVHATLPPTTIHRQSVMRMLQ